MEEFEFTPKEEPVVQNEADFTFTPKEEPDFSKLKADEVVSTDGTNTNASQKMNAVLNSWIGKGTKIYDAAYAIDQTRKSATRGIFEIEKNLGTLAKVAGDNLSLLERNTEKMINSGGKIGTLLKLMGGNLNAITDKGYTEGEMCRLRTVGDSINEIGDLVQKHADSVLKDKDLQLDEEITKGDFMENPSWTRAFMAMGNAMPSLLGMGVLAKISGPLSAYFVMAGVDSADVYEKAKEKDTSQTEANLRFGSSVVATAAIDKVLGPLEHFMKASPNRLSKKLAKYIFDGAIEGVAEGLQTGAQNAFQIYNAEDIQNLGAGVIESMIGGFGSGAVASSLFSEASDNLKKQGATDEEINNLLDVFGMSAQQNADKLSQVAFQEVSKGLKEFDKFIEENMGTPEAQRALKTKAELQDVYDAMYNTMIQAGRPEAEAKSISQIWQGIALFGSQETGMTPMEYLRQNSPKAKAEKYAEFKKKWEEVRNKVDNAPVNPFKLLTDKKAYDEAVKAEKAQKGKSLLAFIKSHGGVIDEGGDLKSRDAIRQYPGLINNKKGNTLDDMARMAWENGYLQGELDYSGEIGRPSINKLLEAIDDELNGVKHYAYDNKEKSVVELVDSMAQAMDELGIDYSNMSAKEAEDAYLKAADDYIRKSQNMSEDEEAQAMADYYSGKPAQNNEIDEWADIPFQFAGEKAQTAALDELDNAKQLEADGVDNEEIRQQTGWFKGIDGKWRFEISDADASLDIAGYFKDKTRERIARWEELLKTHPYEDVKETLSQLKKRLNNLDNMDIYDVLSEDNLNTAKLGDILKHDKLYAAYPQLRDYEIFFYKDNDKNKGGYVDSSTPNRIYINIQSDSFKSDDLKNVLMHEIQHIIQTEEGFARGGSEDDYADIVFKENDKIRKNRANLVNDIVEKKFGKKFDNNDGNVVYLEAFENYDGGTWRYEQHNLKRSEVLNELRKNKDNIVKKQQEFIKNNTSGLSDIGAFEYYRRLAGEIEARNTALRTGFTDETRRKFAPEQTQDVANADAIVVFDDGTVAAYQTGNPEIDNSDVYNELPQNLKDAVDFIYTGKPVYDITGKEFPNDGTSLSDRVFKFYEQYYDNHILLDGFGDIALDKRGINTSKIHGLSDLKANAYVAVPDVLRQGKLVQTEENYDGKPENRYLFVAPVIVTDKEGNKQDYFMEVVVREGTSQNGAVKGKKRFYIHEVELTKKLTDSFTSGVDSAATVSSKSIISSLINDFKQKMQENRKKEMINSEAFKEWSHDAPFYEADKASEHKFKSGKPLVAEVFHGTQRSDRVGTVFRPERATSGPMAFSTDTRSIAEGYMNQKKDTSIYNETEGDFHKYFKVKIPNYDAVTLDRLWNILPYSKKQEVREKAPHITTDENGENIIYDENAKNGNGGYYIEMHGNNALEALIDAWMMSGSLWGEEHKFMEVMKLAGLGEYEIQYVDPDATYPKVYDMFVEMQKPLVTYDIPKRVMNALDKASKKQPQYVEGIGTDFWDKNTRDPIAWMDALKEGDIYVWTSIPDWVTNTLKKLGYDGIVDTGGKFGGIQHNVFIPFYSSQYKSVDNYGTFDANNPDIMYQSAFHGSPYPELEGGHFSLEKVGSGEGAAAHGYGVLYAAKVRDVAEGYRKRLGYENKLNDMVHNHSGLYRGDIEDVIERGKQPVIDKFRHQIEMYQKWVDEGREVNYAQSIIDDSEETIKLIEDITDEEIDDIKNSKGQVYELDLPENPYLLDEQKSYREQSDFVRQAIQEIDRELQYPERKEKIFDNKDDAIDFYDSKIDEFEEKANGYQRFLPESFVTDDGKYGVKYVDDYTINEPLIGDYPEITGEGIYSRIARQLGSQKAASELLEKHGVKGITYFGRTDGRCFVIFNPKDVKVIQKFYQNAERGKGAPKGAFTPDNVIHLFEGADASTFMHETAHWFRAELKRFGTARSREMLRKVDAWENAEFDKRYKVELKDGAYIIKDQRGNLVYDRQFNTEEEARNYGRNEIFARGFEQYLRTGKAPNSYLKSAFKSFWNWLRTLYRSARQLNADINQDIEDVYGTILGGEELDFYLNETPERALQQKFADNDERAKLIDENIARAQAMATEPKMFENFVAERTESKKGKAEFLTNLIVPISTRAKRVSQGLKNRLRAYDYALPQKLNEYNSRIKPFMDKWAKFNQDDMVAFDLALKNDYVNKQLAILEKYDAVDDFEAVHDLLNLIYDEAKSVGVDIGYRENYFPREVADVDGLMSYLYGPSAVSELRRAEREAHYEDMLPEEQAEFVNKFLRGYERKDLIKSLPGNVKERRIDVVTSDMNVFYKNSMQALMTYIERMINSIESRRFWGMDAAHIDESIGAFVDDMIARGEIKPEQDKEVENILRARFKARGVSNKFLLYQKNMAYIYTMGGINSAITQIDDISVALYKAGLWNTVQSIFAPKHKGLSREELGLTRIGEEFMEASASSKAVSAVFKATGLDKIDAFGKNVLINATFKKFQKMANSDEAKLREYLEPIMEQETDSTIEAIKNDEITDNVKLLMFNELADMQPISLSEMPEYYLRSGNGRVLYMLKTFALKRIDIFRNEAFDEMRKGNVKGGVQNLFKLSLLMMLCGMGKDALIDLLFGRKIVLSDAIVNNLLGLFGFSKYQLYRARSDGFTGLLTSVAVPPILPMYSDLFKDMYKSLFTKNGEDIENWEVWKGIPIIGRFYYWWMGGGYAKEQKKKKKLK